MPAGGPADANHIGHSERGLGLPVNATAHNTVGALLLLVLVTILRLTAYPAVLRPSVIPV